MHLRDEGNAACEGRSKGRGRQPATNRGTGRAETSGSRAGKHSSHLLLPGETDTDSPDSNLLGRARQGFTRARASLVSLECVLDTSPRPRLDRGRSRTAHAEGADQSAISAVWMMTRKTRGARLKG